MASRCLRLWLVLALGLVVSPAAYAADTERDGPREDNSLLPICWSPEALIGTDKERHSTRNRERLDLAALRAVALPGPEPVSNDLRGSIRSVALPEGQKLIALTFDLCESNGRTSGYDGGVIDYLRGKDVKATLFVSGKWLETHPERAQQLIADPRFELGGHGLVHRDLSRASAATMADEIVLAEAAFARARAGVLAKSCVAQLNDAPELQERLALMRFPYGRCNAAALSAVANAGQLAIQWDVVLGDPDPHISAKQMAHTITSQAHPGAIVVGHANGNGRNTADALKLAIPKLEDEGYRFVTVSELLAAGRPVIAPSCYAERPRDERRIAHVKPAQSRRSK